MCSCRRDRRCVYSASGPLPPLIKTRGQRHSHACRSAAGRVLGLEGNPLGCLEMGESAFSALETYSGPPRCLGGNTTPPPSSSSTSAAAVGEVVEGTVEDAVTTPAPASQASTWEVIYGGCTFSDGPSGALARSGSCKGQSGQLNLASRGIASVPEGVFEDMGLTR